MKVNWSDVSVSFLTVQRKQQVLQTLTALVADVKTQFSVVRIVKIFTCWHMSEAMEILNGEKKQGACDFLFIQSLLTEAFCLVWSECSYFAVCTQCWAVTVWVCVSPWSTSTRCAGSGHNVWWWQLNYHFLWSSTGRTASAGWLHWCGTTIHTHTHTHPGSLGRTLLQLNFVDTCLPYLC